ERGIEEVFLGQLPGYKLAHRRPGLTPRTRQRVGALPGNRRFRRWSAHRDRRHNFAAILRLVRHSLGIEPRHKSILDLVSVGENISLVEFDHVAEVVYPSHKAVYSARLNHVLPPPAQKFFVKNALDRRRTQLHGRLQRVSIDGIVSGLSRVVSTRSHQSLRVVRFMQCQLWAQGPSAE